jgi:hypothetical protein
MLLRIYHVRVFFLAIQFKVPLGNSVGYAEGALAVELDDALLGGGEGAALVGLHALLLQPAGQVGGGGGADLLLLQLAQLTRPARRALTLHLQQNILGFRNFFSSSQNWKRFCENAKPAFRSRESSFKFSQN